MSVWEARGDPAKRPLDQTLEQLRGLGLPYKPGETVDTWLAVCPACRTGDWGLLIREYRHGSPITLRCSSGCADEAIRDALQRDPVDVRIDAALALAEQARDIAARALQLCVGAA